MDDLYDALQQFCLDDEHLFTVIGTSGKAPPPPPAPRPGALKQACELKKLIPWKTRLIIYLLTPLHEKR